MTPNTGITRAVTREAASATATNAPALALDGRQARRLGPARA